MQQAHGAARSLAFAPGQRVAFDYVNWRGERALRAAEAVSLRHGATEWHPEPQWLLLGRDEERGADREFALRDMVPSPGARLTFAAGQAAAVRLSVGRSVADFPRLAPVSIEFEVGAPGTGQWLLEAEGAPRFPLPGLLPIGGWEDVA